MPDPNEHFSALLGRMTAAICAGDGVGAAACFTEEGIYHDHFYGVFKGRALIARMVRSFFHRDARDFTWTQSDATSDGRRGYARYEFSYVSKIAGSEGKRVGFPGISCCQLDGGLISHYSEIFERAQVLARLGFSDDRIVKSVKHWA
jgi:hypothetical protein